MDGEAGEKGSWDSPRESFTFLERLLVLIFKAVRAVCGREFTYILSETESGEHTVLGSDKWSVKSAAPAAIHGWKDVGAS